MQILVQIHIYIYFVYLVQKECQLRFKNNFNLIQSPGAEDDAVELIWLLSLRVQWRLNFRAPYVTTFRGLYNSNT